MSKTQKLQKIRQQLEADAPNLPLAKTAQNTVPGEGNPDAQVMFIGEAAGYHESVARRPFVGRAGQLLTRTLQEVGIPRETVYISNILKVRPPDNRDPLPEEIDAYKPYLDKEIEIIKPKIIATLGRFSMAKFLGQEVKIGQVHGQPRWVDWQGKKILIMPMYHPAAALRGGFVMGEFKKDFAKLPQLLDTINNKPNGELQPEASSEEAKTEPEKPTDQQLKLI